MRRSIRRHLLLALLLANSLSHGFGQGAEKGAETGETNLFWSFRPIQRPLIPGAKRILARNPIDSFILARLEEKGLKPSAEADRVTLIRRLTFDLTGLPPSPAEVADFLRDKSPRAYDKVVDRLLSSPGYGERWARHWLDVVHFSETHGFEMNQPRPNAWRYRDYVIRAFNEDKPYDRFVREQIAGDSLGADVATGFLVSGPWDQVKSPDEVLTRNQRADEIHDMINVATTTFLGLTVACARCHDHKFDPIPQRDYYALKAIFDGVLHGERPVPVRAENRSDRAEKISKLQVDLASVEREIDAFEPTASPGAPAAHGRAAVRAGRNVERFAAVEARFVRFTIRETTDAEPCLDELEVFSALDSARNVALATQGAKATASGTYSGNDFHKLEHLNDGRYGNERSWISNQKGQGWVQLEFPKIERIDRVVWSRDRSPEPKYQDRLPTRYQIDISLDGTDWKTVASSVDRSPHGTEKPAAPVSGPRSVSDAELEKLRERQKMVARAFKEAASVPKIYGGEFREPEPTRRFNRGDPMQPREPVSPGILSLWQKTSGILQTNTPERERRLALADWMASTNNPLTARVLVNRLWQYHFGEGIVSTPSDFGANGTKPTHPELLDWLAAELMSPSGDAAAPWSIKHLQRLIVTSAAYRQAGAYRPNAAEVDADSRLLWRFPPRRLEAEAIRDSILFVSGKLDRRSGGPGWSAFEPNENYVRVYTPKKEFGPDEFRRMIYATAIRQRPDGIFGVFDCPDGGQIAPKRSRSTTPLQALNLLNSHFIEQASEYFAERLTREAGPDPDRQADLAFSLAFNRRPSAAERRQSIEFIRQNSLPLFCRALFNANEFIYLF